MNSLEQGDLDIYIYTVYTYYIYILYFPSIVFFFVVLNHYYPPSTLQILPHQTKTPEPSPFLGGRGQDPRQCLDRGVSR